VGSDPVQGRNLPGTHVRMLGRKPPVTFAARPDAYLTAIANGDGVALVPESASRYYARPGITYRPVTGVSPSQVGVAWAPANDANPVVQDFVRCCLDNKPRA
jgi:DNA-binding transcriptional LysR family regulator